ncbi:DNA-3-methyladenine glycosylase I [Thermoflavifilum thermophilum]|uniref:DNA-3-methyladenine glycosylase I n=1 Tax=Thermoflavifilum thermophilum TaxID=1393122 RepID=A0A1I7NA51_9BACT|nr:DNA-3-methyladenine glycosylase I [Thermoflavifilum thermophilum]SFV31547.1 DNA-3-methyladenine glycosylase I [Thermoflavifilum thermophilum]
MNRCLWPAEDPLMIQYHDTEWGVPLHDDRKLFEFLVLDAFQAGLSWRTILYKREQFRKAFDAFDPECIAKYDARKIQQLMHNANIIRNRMKIEATVENARRFLEICSRYGSFDQFIWQFTNYQTIHHHLQPGQPAPATSAESDAMSKALRAAGFKFVGSTICYAFMQAAGMINDHVVTCFRYSALQENSSV